VKSGAERLDWLRCSVWGLPPPESPSFPCRLKHGFHSFVNVVTGKNLIWGENTGLLRYFPESSAA
jgi:hypothetical protein